MLNALERSSTSLTPEVDLSLRPCPQESVAMIIWNPTRDKIALIGRRYAPENVRSLPTGHIETGKLLLPTAQNETFEECGLFIPQAKFRQIGKFDLKNPCRRPGGDKHEIYLLEATSATGELPAQTDESIAVEWAGEGRLAHLAKRTYLLQSNSLSERDWKEDPGLLFASIILIGEYRRIRSR